MSPRALNWPRTAQSSLAMVMIPYTSRQCPQESNGSLYSNMSLASMTPRRRNRLVSKHHGLPSSQVPAKTMSALGVAQKRSCLIRYVVELMPFDTRSNGSPTL